MRIRNARIFTALLALIVYLAIPTKDYYWDGVAFAQTIETAHHWTALFHPNHLLYNPLGWVAYNLLGRSVRALYVLQSLNSIFAALSVYVLSGIIADFTKDEKVTVLLSVAFALSGTYWRFATDADAYILSALLLSLCAFILLRSSRPRPLPVAFAYTAAMLIHELSFLFLPAALYLLWKKQSVRGLKRIFAPVLFLVASGVCTLSAYFAAFRLQTGLTSFPEFASWITSHANDVSFSFQIQRNLLISIRSWAQLIFIGRPSIVRYSDPLTIALLLMLVCVIALLIYSILRQRFASNTTSRPNLEALSFALIWLATYAIFLVFWLPNNTFYKLFALPALIIAIASYWTPGANLPLRSPLPLSIAAMALFNLTFGIIPYSYAGANQAIEFALGLQKPLGTNATVYFRDFNTDDWFARYFAPSADWKPVPTTSTIDADLNTGKAVWLETTAIDFLSNTQAAWLQSRLSGAHWHQLVNSKHRIRFVQLSPKLSG